MLKQTAFCVVIVLILSGCGQTGELYLPKLDIDSSLCNTI